MLQLLLDENISYVVADGLLARRPNISVASVHRWHSGELRGQPDPAVLRVAAEHRLTLVTFDQTTILPLLTEWGSLRITHAGVIFVNRRSIRPEDFGGLIRALEALWDGEHAMDWTNRVEFLRPA